MNDLGLSYVDAMHGVQTAIKHTIDTMRYRSTDEDFTSPKHVRVGIDSSHISHLGLAELLVDKGVFTLDEYKEYIRKAANQELYNYERLYGVTFR